MYLRPLRVDDLNQLVSWFPGERALYPWGGPVFNYPLTVAQLGERLLVPPEGDPDSRAWALCDARDRMAGHFVLGRFDRKQKTAMMRHIVVDPEQSGKGLGRILMAQALRLAALQGAEQVRLRVFEFNQPAIRCYSACGFQHAGDYEDTYIIDGVTELWKGFWMSCGTEQR